MVRYEHGSEPESRLYWCFACWRYNQEQCSTAEEKSSSTCDNRIDVSYLHGSSANPDNKAAYNVLDNTLGDFVFTNSKLEETTQDEAFLYEAEINLEHNSNSPNRPLTDGGIYLAFTDRGSCSVIHSIKVFYYYCPQEIKDFAVYPRTTSSSSSRMVQGSCSAGAASEFDRQPKALCNNAGVWDIMKSSESKCLCDSGFEPDNNEHKSCIRQYCFLFISLDWLECYKMRQFHWEFIQWKLCHKCEWIEVFKVNEGISRSCLLIWFVWAEIVLCFVLVCILLLARVRFSQQWGSVTQMKCVGESLVSSGWHFNLPSVAAELRSISTHNICTSVSPLPTWSPNCCWIGPKLDKAKQCFMLDMHRCSYQQVLLFSTTPKPCLHQNIFIAKLPSMEHYEFFLVCFVRTTN